MRLRTKSIITLVTMLFLGIGEAWAGGGSVTVLIQKNGTQISVESDGNGGMTSVAGTIKVLEPSEGKVIIEATPKEGYYITAADITYLKTINGGMAQTREPGVETAQHVTAVDVTDPTGKTTYFFPYEESAAYDYEITANFSSLIDISTATVTLAESTFAYTGEEIKPTVSSVVVGEKTIPSENYEVSYFDNVAPHSATDEMAPTVFITATKLPYSGDVKKTFTITKATPTLKYSKETAEATMKAEFEAPTLTVTPEGLQGITYSSSNTSAATIAEDGKITLVGAGETTIKASFAGDDFYEAAEASYILTVSKITTELKYSTDKATGVMGAEFEAPTLTVTPEGLEGITYSSSNTSAATVAADGKVTLVGAGETIIKASFAGNDTYEAAEASYTLTVNKAVGTGYPLWVGDIQVTEDNEEHILGEGNLTFIYNDETKTLLITNNEDESIVIESRMPLLNVYLNGDNENKLKAIYYNNLGDDNSKGSLYITCYDNTKSPSNVTIKNDAGKSVIYGFEEIKFNTDAKLSFVEPEKTKYNYTGGQMMKTVTNDDGTTTTSVADELSIAQLLTPIDKTVSFDVRNMQVMDKDGNLQYNEDGSPKLVNTDNAIVSDVLITLSNNNGTTLNGYSDATEDGDNRSGLVIETENMTDAFVLNIAANVLNDVYTPGDNDFANSGYIGLTILLPAGYGNIQTDLNADPDYDFHILIAENTASRPNILGKGVVLTPFRVTKTTYCYIYLVKNNAAGTRLGKREKVHGKVYAVGVSLVRSTGTNPPSEASGGALNQSNDPQLNQETTGIFSISRKPVADNKWHTLDGRELQGKPTKPGFYIYNNQKMVIK